MTDILFQAENYTFSYRTAGILIRDGKILLQKPTNSDEYALPGGHVPFGETHADTLKREWKEEMGADVTVGELKQVEENIFPWGGRMFQQICVDYFVSLKNENQIPLNGSFPGIEHIDGRDYDVHFHWIAVEKLGEITVYPANLAELMKIPQGEVCHFVYRG